jgi:hypothetical protein
VKRNAVDLITRALKSAFANWQLVAIRMVEGVVFLFLIVVALLATIIPAAVAAGLGRLNLRDTDQAGPVVAEFIVNQWPLILWTIVVLFVVTGVMIVIHSLIVAGSSRVYLDAERAAASSDTVEAFTIFRSESFWAAAKRGFWRTFWIYNIAWGIAALIVCVPLLIALLLVRFTGDTTAMVVLTILILVVSALMAIPIGWVTAVWVGRALIDGERNQLSARAALAAARKAIRADLGNHIVVPLLVAVAGIIAVGAVSSIGSVFSISDIYAPMQLMLSLVQTAVSALASAWMLASFAALAEN